MQASRVASTTTTCRTGTQAIVAVSLGSLGQSKAAATFAHENGAREHGCIVVVGVPSGHRAIAPNPLDADAQRLKVGAAEDDPPVSGEVQGLLLSVLRVFFREVRNVAPGLGESWL